MVRFHTDALQGLSSQKQLELLNAVDGLRSQGISQYISLPQIIVCGDQSSGKSSVLEAISGVAFPVQSNLCTRFPTELILRKSAIANVKVSIVDHHDPGNSQNVSFGGFHQELTDFNDLPQLIETAKSHMGIRDKGKTFSKDILRIEVSGPDRPHLTIVDLPGLIHSATNQQSAQDVELVHELVQSYMASPRSIILAVVSAKNDVANQIVLKLANAADKNGDRTLGIITKPDTLVSGSFSEGQWIRQARNEAVFFRYGWHTLKNMDSDAGESTLNERNKQEKEFFSEGVWAGLPKDRLGVDELRPRLSNLLLRQIVSELPSLMTEIEEKLVTCEGGLANLGTPRATFRAQQSYLIQISQLFQSLVKASVDGTYNDHFFGESATEIGYQKRIRAKVQNLNMNFSQDITNYGHYRQIGYEDETIVSLTKADGTKPSAVPSIVTRDTFIEHVQSLMPRSRARELPGTFNPMIIADLFREQSQPWEQLARDHIDAVWEAISDFLEHVSEHIADEATSNTLFQTIFNPALKQLLADLNNKAEELLKPHQSSHPITYSNNFVEKLQEIRQERHKAEIAQVVRSHFAVSSTKATFTPVRDFNYDLEKLVIKLANRAEPDIIRFSCSEALDYMYAYYAVALERFIDDMSVEVIEEKLVMPLARIFSPSTVIEMSDEVVTQIAGEPEESRAERAQLTKQKKVLAKGLVTCKRFVGLRRSGEFVFF
ncbi:hypothetical protein NHQ30_002265 [Ciborinia camelliae]|nr:hypothetical protein NHQ30_002265 [Ciborinia camelliae]